VRQNLRAIINPECSQVKVALKINYCSSKFKNCRKRIHEGIPTAKQTAQKTESTSTSTVKLADLAEQEPIFDTLIDKYVFE